MQRDSVGNTIKVAAILCVVCSVVVSLAAVGLRSLQEANRVEEMRKNILLAAGVYDPDGASVEDQFTAKIEPRIVDLGTSWYAQGLDVDTFDQDRAARDPDTSTELTSEDDIAGIKRRESFAYVYLVEKEGQLDQIVLPIRGYGLWSTLKGFLSIDATSLENGPDQAEIRGITYYEHKETPGLGGEVDNPDWKALWVGKKVFADDWQVEVEVTKGAEGDYEVDALSGATITSNGVTNMMKFWLGDQGFGPYLQRLQTQPTE